jgi:hypothetical protein
VGPYAGGTLACDPDTCRLDPRGCDPVGRCGNYVVEAGEDCDGSDLAGADCTSIPGGYPGGELRCTLDCRFDPALCLSYGTMTPGSPCATDAECPGDYCAEEQAGYWDHAGAPGGYCFERCDASGGCPLAGDLGICLYVSSGTQLCFGRCRIDGSAEPRCREGLRCADLGDPVWGYCRGDGCTDSAQCLAGGDCDLEPGSDTAGFCVTPPEICDNGLDDDFDGTVDCTDPECIGQAACPEGEVCDNGVDDDGDGYVDCADAECGLLGLCTGDLCTPLFLVNGPLGCGDERLGQRNDQEGSTNVIQEAICGDTSSTNHFVTSTGSVPAPEIAFPFEVDEPRRVCVVMSGYSGDLDLRVIRRIQGRCDARLGCLDQSINAPGQDETICFSAFPGIRYYLLVDGYQGTISTFDLRITCSEAYWGEICDNGLDDDGDQLVDCADPECHGAPGCTTESLCDDHEDNDLDGLADCLDPDCQGTAACP